VCCDCSFVGQKSKKRRLARAFVSCGLEELAQKLMAQSNSALQRQQRSALLVWSPPWPWPADQRPPSTPSVAHSVPRCLSSLRTRPSAVWPYEVLVPVMIVQANCDTKMAPSWERRVPHAIVVGVRVASAVAASDRTFGHAPTLRPKLISWQSMSARTSFGPSLSQQWTRILITVTNARGSSTYVLSHTKSKCVFGAASNTID